MTDVCRYFPVRPGALRMEAGLFRLGTDFGNGAADSRFFQFDSQIDTTLAAKRLVLARAGSVSAPLCRSEAELGAHRAVLSWLDGTLRREASERFHGPSPPSAELGEQYVSLARQIQEDFVVLRRDEQREEQALAVCVCFPSGWRPERILGQNFLAIHASIPEFERVGSAADALVSAMLERGPYVRFVWTLVADPFLDHHPEHGQRASFAEPTASGYLRVERQLTVPFPAVGASLFLIRTYLYPFDELTAAQRSDIASALRAMPPALRQYKRLAGFEPRILELLGRARGID